MTSSSASPDPLDLLTLQRRSTAAPRSAPSRDETFYGVRVVQAAPSLACRVLPGSSLPPAVLDRVEEVVREVGSAPLPTDALISAVRPAVEDGGVPRLEGGPVYDFEATLAPPGPARTATIVTSAAARRPNELLRPSTWDDAEWGRLLEGSLGPWAAALVEDEVAALCHTPKVLLPLAAECGVWTDPRWRRLGLGATVTAAWARTVGDRARHLFYSHDHRNEASARVARRLRLRQLGWEWTISAEPWPERDAWGEALLDHLRGRWTPVPELEVHGGGVGEAMHPGWFFRDFDAWDWWERELLPLAARSPALDLGAGAGRAALWLQGRGAEVTAVDSSPGAVEVCRARGVIDARVGDLKDPPTDQRWRLILLLCGNLGLGGSFEGNRRLLQRLADAAAPDALLLGDTVEAGGQPEIGLRIRYRGSATPWWRQRNVPVREVDDLVEGTGWVIERHVVDLPDHALLLRRS